MLHRRFVGKPIAHTELYAVDTRRAIDPYDLHGKTMVLGWFDSATCTGCAPVFGKIAAWLHNSTMNNEVVMLAISPPSMHRSPAEAFDQLRLYAKALEVPLAMTDETQFDQFALSDHERINFMVLSFFFLGCGPQWDTANGTAFDRSQVGGNPFTRVNIWSRSSGP